MASSPPSLQCRVCGDSLGFTSARRRIKILGSGEVIAVCSKPKCARSKHATKSSSKKAPRTSSPPADGPIVMPDSWPNASLDVLEEVRAHLDVVDLLNASTTCQQWGRAFREGVTDVHLPMLMTLDDARYSDCRSITPWSSHLNRAMSMLPDVTRCVVDVQFEDAGRPGHELDAQLLVNLHHLSRWDRIRELVIDQRDTCYPIWWDRSCFGAIARMTSLTRLTLNIDAGCGRDDDLSLHVLSALVKLERLQLTQLHGCYGWEHRSWRYMSDLSALTSLRDLHIDGQLLPSASWADLTGLTRLVLDDLLVDEGDDMQQAAAFLESVLVKVSQLPELAVLHLRAAHIVRTFEHNFSDLCATHLKRIPDLRIDMFCGRAQSAAMLTSPSLNSWRRKFGGMVTRSTLMDLADLSNLSHLSTSYYAGEPLKLHWLSNFTRLTSLGVRMDLDCTPALPLDMCIARWSRQLSRLTHLALRLPAALLQTTDFLPQLRTFQCLRHLDIYALHNVPDASPVNSSGWSITYECVGRSLMPRFDLAWLPVSIQAVQLSHLLIVAAPTLTASGTAGGTCLPQLQRVRCLWLTAPPAMQMAVVWRLRSASRCAALPALEQVEVAVDDGGDLHFALDWSCLAGLPASM